MKVRLLSKALQEKAEEELNEVPSQNEERVRSLRNWLQQQEHLIYRDDDQLLLNFLRGSKFSLQRAKAKMDAYYSFRSYAPELVQNMDPYLPVIQKMRKMGMGVRLPMPKEDPAGPRILLHRHEDYDPNEITLAHILKNGAMGIDVMFNEDDNYVISGAKVIWDMKGIKFGTALQATPDLVRKLVLSYEKALPIRLKAIYVVNMPKFFEQILNLCKRLLSKKLAKRLHFYSTDNWEAVYKDIPKSCLPYEYGGEGGRFEDIKDNWNKIIESHRQRLVNEDNYYSDESRRRSIAHSWSTIYGVEGSFRTLEID